LDEEEQKIGEEEELQSRSARGTGSDEEEHQGLGPTGV
jgi:hypothetical protein